MFMDWLRKAPTPVTITVIISCFGFATVLVAAFVWLESTGADTAEFRQWVNTLGTLLGFPLIGTAAVASISSARSSSRAEEQTNGQLAAKDDRIRELEAELARRDGGRLR